MADKRDWRRVDGQYGAGFPEMLEAARQFWRVHGLDGMAGDAETTQESERYVVVELLTQDIRVNLRNLSMAATLSLQVGARMVAVVGCDPTWVDVVFTGYDAEALTRLAHAYGAYAVLDVAAFAAAADMNRVPDVPAAVCSAPAKPSIPQRRLSSILDSTYARIARVPEARMK